MNRFIVEMQIRNLLSDGVIKLPDVRDQYFKSSKGPGEFEVSTPVMSMAIVTSEYLPKGIAGILVGTVCKHCGRPMTSYEFCKATGDMHQSDCVIVRDETHE